MAKQRNIIVEQMPYAVAKRSSEGVLFNEARFRSVSDACDFRDLVAAKYGSFELVIVFQFYNDRGALMMHEWGQSLAT